MVIAARDREFTDKEARTAALEVGASYRREMARLAGLSTLDVWYSHIDVAGLLAELEATAGKTGSKADKRMAARTAQADRQRPAPGTASRRSSKLTTVVDGQLRIVSDPPLIVPTEELFSQDVSDAHPRVVPPARARLPTAASSPTGATCSRSSSSSRSPARWWVWGASAPGPGSC